MPYATEQWTATYITVRGRVIARLLVSTRSLLIGVCDKYRMTAELANERWFSSLQLHRGSNQREAMVGAQARPIRATSLMKLRLVI
jgi:hypothetical protein